MRYAVHREEEGVQEGVSGGVRGVYTGRGVHLSTPGYPALSPSLRQSVTQASPAVLGLLLPRSGLKPPSSPSCRVSLTSCSAR